MTEGQALLRGILAEPEDDAPRLVFADWLEDQGQAERGQFIRLQCEYERLSTDDPLREELYNTIIDYQKRYLNDWLGPLDPNVCRKPSTPNWHFHRGLLHWWYIRAIDFLEKGHQRDVCAHFPRLGVHQIFLSEPTKRVAKLAESSALGWTEEFVWWHCRAGDAALRVLVQSPHFDLLSRLSLSGLHCGDAGMRAIAESPSLGNLRTLYTWSNQYAKFTAEGVLTLLNSEQLPNFCELRLDEAVCDVLPITRDSAIGRLRLLWLYGSASLEAIRALVENPHTAGLESLCIGSNPIDDDTVLALLESPYLEGLRDLRMHRVSPTTGSQLSPEVEKRLRERFGEGLTLSYRN